MPARRLIRRARSTRTATVLPERLNQGRIKLSGAGDRADAVYRQKDAPAKVAAA